MIEHPAFLVAEIIKNEILKEIGADEQMGKIARPQDVRQRIC